MVRFRMANLLMVMVLLLVTAFGSLVGSSPSHAERSAALQAATPHATPVANDSLRYEAVSPDYRGEMMAATSERVSHYTIEATLRAPGFAPDAKPDASPAATPWASPVTSPAASLVATPVVATMATPMVPGVTPLASPAPITESRAVTPAEELTTIEGTVEVRFVNETGAPLEEIYLRLYPNLPQYGEGRMVVRDITVDGLSVAPEPPLLHAVPGATPIAIPDVGSGDLILLRLPLPEPLASDEAATVSMAFTTTVPMASPDVSGLFAFTPDTGTLALAHWFPMLAGYDPSSGWEVEPPAAWSDPVFSNTALFDVTLTAPADLVLVTTGVQVDEDAQGDQQVQRFVSGPAREFTVVADDDFASVSTEVNGTTVTSYYNPQDAAGGAQVLEWGAQSLAIFTELFGAYPYSELDLVAVPGIIGFEFPQLVFIGAEFYPDPVALGSRPGAIEFLVAHEVSHQWWYGLVGNNQYRHAFLDEGLAEYSGVLYFEQQYGEEAAEAHLDAGLRLRYATLLLTAEDEVVDQPSAAFPDLTTYYATVYRKAGLGFAALRAEIGDAAFFSGLQNYAESTRFEVGTPDDLQEAFEQAADRKLDAFWHLWFETASGRVEILMELATPAPATPELASPIATPDEEDLPLEVATPVAATPEVVMPLATPAAEPVITGTPEAVAPEIERGRVPDELAEEALETMERALQAQRDGDWETYGQELERLQRILENMAGNEGTPATPIATPETATPEGVGQSGSVGDRASLVDALRAAGLTVDIVDTVEQPFLQPESGTVLGLSGGELGQPAELQVFEYRDAERAAADAAQIGPDGQPPTMMISWLATPHFYQAGQLIVLYVGDDQAVVDVLTALLGPPFAGG